MAKYVFGKVILEIFRKKLEIDYEKCSDLLFKLISSYILYKNLIEMILQWRCVWKM